MPGPRQVDLVDALHGAGAGGEDAHAVGERDRLLEVVRHEDDRRRCRRPQVEQLVLHQRARLHVERAERLVHQDDLGRGDQALRERGPLAHAPRELMRVVVFEPGEADLGDPLACARVRLPLRYAAEPQAGRDVADHALPREEHVSLEDVPEIAADPGDGAALHEHFACARRRQAGDESERRRLPAAGRPYDRKELTAADGERQVTERRVDVSRRRTEPFGDVAQLDGWRPHRAGSYPCRDFRDHACHHTPPSRSLRRRCRSGDDGASRWARSHGCRASLRLRPLSALLALLSTDARRLVSYS